MDLGGALPGYPGARAPQDVLPVLCADRQQERVAVASEILRDFAPWTFRFPEVAGSRPETSDRPAGCWFGVRRMLQGTSVASNGRRKWDPLTTRASAAARPPWPFSYWLPEVAAAGYRHNRKGGKWSPRTPRGLAQRKKGAEAGAGALARPMPHAHHDPPGRMAIGPGQQGPGSLFFNAPGLSSATFKAAAAAGE
jgi:hypothetical protein